MSLAKVTPTRLSLHGTYSAPTMYVETEIDSKRFFKEHKSKAEELARAKSGLGKFKSWEFKVR